MGGGGGVEGRAHVLPLGVGQHELLKQMGDRREHVPCAQQGVGVGLARAAAARAGDLQRGEQQRLDELGEGEVVDRPRAEGRAVHRGRHRGEARLLAAVAVLARQRVVDLPHARLAAVVDHREEQRRLCRLELPLVEADEAAVAHTAQPAALRHRVEVRSVLHLGGVWGRGVGFGLG